MNPAHKILIPIIICALVIPVFSLAQETSDYTDSFGEQLSPEEMQQLEDVLSNVSEAASTAGDVSYANDFNIDIVWKADTLVPFDYQGKALPGVASRLHFYALADFPNPERLIYTWIIDDASSTRDGPELSGIGESRFSMITYRIPNYTHIVKVTVQDPATEKSASMTLELDTVMPEAIFYWSINDNYGRASSEMSRLAQGSQNNLLARIFNINASGFNNLNFKWLLNNSQEQNSNPRKEMIPINISERSPVGSQATLRLDVINTGLDESDFTQKASAQTTLFVTKALD